jgi:hypothetical protein
MGLIDIIKRRLPGRRRHEPDRETVQFPNQFVIGSQNDRTRPAWKPTPRNLRAFSHTPIARRAINAIKNPIAMLQWEVRPIEGLELNSELQRQIDVVTACLNTPNAQDSFRTLIEQVIEDYMLGAGTVEMVAGGDEQRPLWLFPVDSLSIQIYAGWDGDARQPRFAQYVGYSNAYGGGKICDLLNDELMYIRPNPSTATPFGRGPLEIAFETIANLLGVGQFAGKLASNARPNIFIDLGPGVDEATVLKFREFFTNEVEGQGKVPITSFGSSTNPKDKTASGVNILRLHPEGDAALYLEYQEWLARLVGVSFDLSPQNLGIERDVNRSTSEVAEDRDWDQAIKPCASLLGSHLTRDAIQGKLGFSQLEFVFVGLDREDEVATADIFEIEYQNNACTPNEHREKTGRPPGESPWMDMTRADVEIAMNAARGAAEVDDPGLPGKSANNSNSATKARRETRKAKTKGR